MTIQTSPPESTFDYRMPTYCAALLDNEHTLENTENTQWLDRMAVLLGVSENMGGNTTTVTAAHNNDGNGDFGPFDVDMFDPLATFYEQVYLMRSGGVYGGSGSPAYTESASINDCDDVIVNDDDSSSGSTSSNIARRNEEEHPTAATATTASNPSISFANPDHWAWQITTLIFAWHQLHPSISGRAFVETAIELIREHQMSVQIVLRRSTSSSNTVNTTSPPQNTTTTTATTPTANTAGTTRINIREYLHETDLRANAHANATTVRALETAVWRLRLARDLIGMIEGHQRREMTGWDVMRYFFT